MYTIIYIKGGNYVIYYIWKILALTCNYKSGLQRGAKMSLVANFLGFLSHLFLVQHVAVAFSSEQNVAVITFNFKQLFALLFSLELAQLQFINRCQKQSRKYDEQMRKTIHCMTKGWSVFSVE